MVMDNRLPYDLFAAVSHHDELSGKHEHRSKRKLKRKLKRKRSENNLYTSSLSSCC